MGWGCGSLAVSTAPLPRLPTGQQPTRPPLCSAAPARLSPSTAPAPPSDRTVASPLALGCRPSLLSLLAHSSSRRGPLLNTSARGARQLRRVAEYVFPDPIPDFAVAVTDSGVDTYFGLCTYPGREQRHRIDFKVYPRDIYAFGLIAWTGNDVLNRRLRLLAESKGYRLDDTGLFLAAQSSHGKRGAKASTSIHCQTEREVFDLLGFPWLEPHERNL